MQLTQKQLNLVATVMMSALCLAICATTVAQSTSAGREQDIARANELRRRIEAEQLQRIERLKDSFEMKIAETTQLLATLAEETERFHKEREELLTNEQGKAFGMVTFDNCIVDLYEKGLITEETAKAYASNRSNVGRGIDAIKSTRGEKTTDLDRLEVDRSYGKNMGKLWL